MPGVAVEYVREGALATITLNRPEVLNAFTPDMLAELGSALQQARMEGARALLLTGAGRGFSAGMDLASIEGEYAHGGPDFVELLEANFYPVLRELLALPMPIVCAVNGVAAGAGMSIALACDLRVASDKARFVTAFTNIALVPDCGMAYILPRLVGAGRAAELMLLSEPLSASEALAMGLVSRVVPAEQVAEEAANLARKLAAGPTRAYAATKRLIDAGQVEGFDAFLAREARAQAQAGATKDHQNAVAAFLAKQPPVFEGA